MNNTHAHINGVLDILNEKGGDADLWNRIEEH